MFQCTQCDFQGSYRQVVQHMIIAEGMPMGEPRQREQEHGGKCKLPLPSVNNRYFRAEIDSQTVLRLACHGPLVNKPAWCVELHYKDEWSLRHAIASFNKVPQIRREISKSKSKQLCAEEWDMESGVTAFRHAISLDDVHDSRGANADELICEYWDKICQAGANTFGANIMANVFSTKEHVRVNELAPGIFYMVYRSNLLAASSFMRMSEYYESPSERFYRKKNFSVDDYKAWSRKQHGQFQFYNVWPGFNVPGWVVRDVLRDLALGPLMPREAAVAKCLPSKLLAEDTSPFYVIVAVDDDMDTLKHEYGHALYYMNPEYRSQAQAIVSRLTDGQRKVMRRRLVQMGYAAHDDAIILDEIHAYLLEGNYLGALCAPETDPKSLARLNSELTAAFVRFGGTPAARILEATNQQQPLASADTATAFHRQLGWKHSEKIPHSSASAGEVDASVAQDGEAESQAPELDAKPHSQTQTAEQTRTRERQERRVRRLWQTKQQETVHLNEEKQRKRLQRQKRITRKRRKQKKKQLGHLLQIADTLNLSDH